jgi:hypothetical protein
MSFPTAGCSDFAITQRRFCGGAVLSFKKISDTYLYVDIPHIRMQVTA